MRQETHIISVGDRVTAGLYSLHSRFERVVNFKSNTSIVSFVTEEVGAGPNNIVYRGAASGLKRAPTAVLTEDKFILIGGDCFSTAGIPRFNSTLELNSGTCGSAGDLAILESFLVAHAQEKSLCFLLDPRREVQFRSGFELGVVRAFKNAKLQIGSGELCSAIRGVQGLGWGLTPSGDDFVTGLLIGARIYHLPVLSEIIGAIDFERLAPLSALFLRNAAEGRVCGRWKNLLQELAGGNSCKIMRAAERVLQVGASSGADTLVGFIIAARLLRGREG